MSPEAVQTRSRFVYWLLAAMALGLVFRLVHLYEIREMGFWLVPLGDAKIYDDRAAGIAAGDWAGPADFVHAPLYAYLVALPRLLGLEGLQWVRFIQVGFGVASIGLVGVLGRRWFSARAGILAAFLYAALPSAIYFDGLIEKSSLAVLLSLGMLWCVNKGAGAMALWRWGLAGVLLGLLVLTRQNALALLPLLLLWAACDERWVGGGREAGAPRRVGRDIAAAALVIAGFAAAVAPWAIRNKQVIGDAVISTPNMGQNFWMGNDPRSTGTYLSFQRGKVNPEHEQAEWVKEAEAAAGRTLSAKEVSNHFMAKGLKFILDQPIDWLKLTGKKIMLTLSAYELPDTEDYYLYLRHAALIRVLDVVLHFGVLVPMAAAGIVLTAGSWRRLWPLYAYLIITVLSVAVFVVFARYRFPLAPVLVMFAAGGLAQLRYPSAGPPAAPARGRAGGLGQGGAGLAALAFIITALLANVPARGERQPEAFAFVNHGGALQNQGRLDEAVGEYITALAIAPGDADANAEMASALLALGRAPEGLAHAERALAVDGSFVRALVQRGRALVMLGRAAEAVPVLQRALQLSQSELEAREVLGWALGLSGRVPEAIAELERAAASRGASPATDVNLGSAYAAAGRFEEAARAFARAREKDPESVDAITAMAMLAAQRGELAEAARLADQALALRPGHAPALQVREAASRNGPAAGGPR